MKQILLITTSILIFSIFGCKYENTDPKYIAYAKSDLLQSIDRIFEQDGKYFLLKCRFFEYRDSRKKIREINVSDTLIGVDYQRNGYTSSFTVKELSKDNITFSFQSRYNYSNNFSLFDKEKTGEFSIKCSTENEILSSFKVEGLEVNKQAALEHIAEGKIYRLVELDESNHRGSEKNIDSTECKINAIKKYGYVNYYLDECLPFELFHRQVSAYNDAVFEYLAKSKNLKAKSFGQLENTFQEEIRDCLYPFDESRRIHMTH